jgi:hypothetical protein
MVLLYLQPDPAYKVKKGDLFYRMPWFTLTATFYPLAYLFLYCIYIPFTSGQLIPLYRLPDYLELFFRYGIL